MPARRAKRPHKKKARKVAKKKARPKPKPRAKTARQKAKGSGGKTKRAPRTAKPRPLRIKKRKGPLQLGLPLQMPLALGREAFAERAPTPSAPASDKVVGDGAPAADQQRLFS